MAANRSGRRPSCPVANVDVTGVVTDSTNGQPLESAEVTIANAGGAVVANTTTNTFGGFTIHNIGAGSYSISVHLIGYRPVTQPLSIAAVGERDAAIEVQSHAGRTEPRNGIRVVAPATVTVDTRSGDQVFKQNDFHGAPTVTTSQIIQAVDRRSGARADRRGAHSRTARRIHVLHRRRPGAARNLRVDERAVRSADREPDQLPDRWLGRGIRWPERGGRERRDQDPLGRLPRQLQRIRRRLLGIDGFGTHWFERPVGHGQRQQWSVGLLPLRRAAIQRHAFGAGRHRSRHEADQQLPQRRHRLLRIRQAPVLAQLARRVHPRGKSLDDQVRRPLRLERRRIPKRPSERREQLRQPRLASSGGRSEPGRPDAGRFLRWALLSARVAPLRPRRARRSGVSVLPRHELLQHR